MERGARVFEQILGSEWQKLGEIIRRHYFLKPYSNDRITVSGRMSEVYHSAAAKLFIPMGVLFGAIVPYRGRDVPIDVHYNAHPDNACIYWDRVFRFPRGKTFHFRSHMEHVSGNRVIEFVRFGIGLKLRVTAENGALVFRDEGYLWRIFGRDIPLPGRFVIGRAYVEERPVDDSHFTMEMRVSHPVFGLLFRYRGQFTMPETNSAQ